MTTRRRFLQGSTAALGVKGPLLSAAARKIDEDARLADLITALQSTDNFLLSFIKDAEHMRGVLSYELNDDLRKHHERILAARDDIEAEIAMTRPKSLKALLTKMRMAFYCDHLSQAEHGCVNEEVLYPALCDLERLAKPT